MKKDSKQAAESYREIVIAVEGWKRMRWLNALMTVAAVVLLFLSTFVGHNVTFAIAGLILLIIIIYQDIKINVYRKMLALIPEPEEKE
jgi:hypothetical protein